MRKVYIITIHDVGNNVGSAIQSTSLYQYIKGLGYDVKIIDYKPNDRKLLFMIYDYIKDIIFIKSVCERSKSYKSFFYNYSVMTKKYSNIIQLKNDFYDSNDVFITGSDQLWNVTMPRGRDLAYFLKFTKSSHKFSYAASLGTVLSDQQIKRIIKLASDYKFISVRETKSREQLFHAGRNDVAFCIDPVFLYDRNYYLGIEKKPSVNICSSYILVYAVGKNEIPNDAIRKIANGRKIIAVGGLRKKVECDIFMRNIGPQEFLYLLSHSDGVVVTSFHGMALSIIYHKEFRIYLPTANSLRLTNILDLIDLSQLVDKDEAIDNHLIDYDQVDKKLSPHINMSKKHLEKWLKEMQI
ncbi:Polysaccharide pyruvyl transferase [Ruminococcus sp. YE71]|uniref:polysaccharide pyruvyl transferase family protein n=1 Tax=unclassified Ruminococcus TaxID=2608920 RepID=UPI000884F018|nr:MULTISPECIES: polysaccharide pyruvyl transferase family protein [unclassified Ruminococcus]SDA30815.1 Polysaccharide pyruvyl transferase [Ruminococcus sp. YE78]SFW50522.1 Polysaccharide pyruvyl transferase [Ruminococcus sp. YE71]